MNFPSSIKTSSPIDRGIFIDYPFEIIESNQEKALRELLEWLTPQAKIFISDHRKGDSEGGVIVKIDAGKIKYMRGGHGYSSNWFKSPRNQALYEMLEAIESTKWGASNGNGTISIYHST